MTGQFKNSKLLDLESDFELARCFLYMTFVQKGMYRDAIQQEAAAWFEKAPPEERLNIVAMFERAYDERGLEGLWRKHIELFDLARKYSDYSEFMTMYAYMKLGENDQAFRGLDRLADAKDPSTRSLNVDPTFDGLRSDPRFQRLLTRVGLIP